jgi:hypothetical protein|tara:strand:+ start:2040 stop:2477 length:438 start_codon:yes stop_codon:yes gene_type:complete
MIQYWSWWNFTWFISSETGLANRTNALKTSIIITSVIGGYMTYVYPRKIVFRIRGKKYSPNYTILVIGDIIVHQIPLLTILYYNKPLIKNDCGNKVLIPFACWSIINYYNDINVDKLYGIKMIKLVSISGIILGGYGLCHHYNRK